MLFKHWFQLGRVGMAPLTMSVPVLGAYTTHTPALGEVMGLALLGLCAHYFGFGLNDLLDLPVDRTVPERQTQPLVTGALPLWQAWALGLGQIPLALVLHWILRGETAWGWLVASGVGSVLYNLGSKWGRWPALTLGAEVALAASVGCLCVVGAGQPAGPSYAVALTLALNVLLLNSVASGLKDLKTDAAYGARSWVRAAGARMVDADQFTLSHPLRVYAWGVQILLIASLVWAGWLIPLPGWAWGAIGLLTLYGALHLRLLLSLTAFAALRRARPLLTGYYHYAAWVWLLFPALPLPGQGLLALLTLGLLALPWAWAWRWWRKGGK